MIYAIDPNKFPKYALKNGEVLNNNKLDNGWTAKELGDLGELYIDKIPKYKVKNNAAVKRTLSERTPDIYEPSDTEILENKKRERKLRYVSESDGLFFTLKYNEIKSKLLSDRTADEITWLDAVDAIKSDIPL